MIKLYMKQAWAMLKQNKIFSALYIAGTALALAMTMAVFVVHYTKVAPVYPETNRPNMYVLRTIQVLDEGMQNWHVSYTLLRDWWYPIQSAEAVSGTIGSRVKKYVEPDDGRAPIAAMSTYTDPAFFKVFEFDFLSGTPFTEADLQSGIRSVVLGANIANQLFGTVDVVGRTFTMDRDEYRVAGVVRNASALTPNSYGDLYLPYTLYPGYQYPAASKHELTGPFWVYFLVKDAEQGKALEAEAKELERKYNASQDERTLGLWGPDPAWKIAYRHIFGATDWTGILKKWVGLFFVFLLVPALNLSGMISTRMDIRLPEMGISKAFGASKGRLLRQVLGENLILTCLGGFLGLCMAWLFVFIANSWLFRMAGDSLSRYTGTGMNEISLQADMLFSPGIFITAFLVCLFLNVLSALIPAWNALRKDIVYSLSQKK